MASELNLEQARFNMIEQQIRPWEVLDQRVLDVVAATPREQFVPEQYRRLAFADTQIPLGEGEVMMEPKLEARLVQALQIQPGDTALEIGTGSGYLCALLGRLASWVTSVEYHQHFSDRAGRQLKAAAIDNVTLAVGDALAGWKAPAQYDVIAVTGSVPVVTHAFDDALKPGGRLFMIVGHAPIMEAILLTRTGTNGWLRESMFETLVPPLIGSVMPQRFVF